MGVIRDFIKRKEQEVIKESNVAVNELNRAWATFLKKDTYLIYPFKTNLLNQVKRGNKETRIPWYFFWHFKLKSKLRDNLEKLAHFHDEIETFNPSFVLRKKAEYKHLFKKDSLVLDDDQQNAVIKDDKHNLVVAGAGSGKTEVLITRIAYLVKRKSDIIKPERILALAFQNKAAQEVKHRLEKRYNIKCIIPKDINDIDNKNTNFTKKGHVTIGTFHSLGNKIINDAHKGKTSPNLKKECKKEWRYQIYIQNLFNEELTKNRMLEKNIFDFMTRYADTELIKEEPKDPKEKDEFYKYMRNLKYTALNGQPVESEAEREILNFFLMHKLNGNRINVQYEEPAQWMKYKDKRGNEYTPKPDFYFPNFDIYLEHWAIGKNGKVPEWFNGENPTENYIRSMNIKKQKFIRNNKKLIETKQSEFQEGNFIKILEKRFLYSLKEKFPKETFELTHLSYEELVNSTWDSAKFVKQIPKNMSSFIRIAKTYRLYPEDIKARLEEMRWSPKQIAFTKVANIIYDKYQKELKNRNEIDFSDMINRAVDYLENDKNLFLDVYNHILIDEFQDISTQRYDLIKSLMSKNQKCKLFCVGDDWQSIMGFSGSNLDYFSNFSDYFNNPEKTDLTRNYRSIKTIVDVGKCIINHNRMKQYPHSKEKGQIPKEAIAGNQKLSQIEKPILVFSSLHKEDFYMQYYEQITIHCFDKINELHNQGCPYGDILVLMRIASENKKIWGFIDKFAEKMNIPIIKESHKTRPDHVRFMSVHKSKGLQAKVVIVLNVDKGLYGFPCELENPDIFEPATKNNDGMKEREQEERRLFYVAVTRAKEEVIMYTQRCSESKFLTEIKDFTKREELGY